MTNPAITTTDFRPLPISPTSNPIRADAMRDAARLVRVLAPHLRDVTGPQAAEIIAEFIEARVGRLG